MRVAVVMVVCSAVVFCGCAGQRAFRPPTSGGPSGGSFGTDSSSDLGLPSPSLPGGSNSSSSYPPSGGSSPTLGPLLPAARKDSAAGREPRSAQLHAPTPKPRTTLKPAEPPANPVSAFERPIIVDSPKWNRYYRSTERRPIETTVLGTGPLHIAVLASLHGDELQSVALLDEMARFLRQNPDVLRKTSLLLIKSPNPDGSFSRSPYNSRGVDLNHNFPSANWVALASKRAGAHANSEIETKAIIQLLTDFKPGLLVHVKDSRTGGFVNFDGSAQARAEQIAELLCCQIMQGRGERTAGSIENYAQSRLSCPSLTLLLPLAESNETAWAANREALLSLCQPSAGRGNSQGTGADELRNSIKDQPDPFEDGAVRNPPRKRQPPIRNTSKSGENTRLPEFPAPVPEHGYLELPPP